MSKVFVSFFFMMGPDKKKSKGKIEYNFFVIGP